MEPHTIIFWVMFASFTGIVGFMYYEIHKLKDSNRFLLKCAAELLAIQMLHGEILSKPKFEDETLDDFVKGQSYEN